MRIIGAFPNKSPRSSDDVIEDCKEEAPQRKSIQSIQLLVGKAHRQFTGHHHQQKQQAIDLYSVSSESHSNSKQDADKVTNQESTDIIITCWRLAVQLLCLLLRLLLLLLPGDDAVGGLLCANHNNNTNNITSSNKLSRKYVALLCTRRRRRRRDHDHNSIISWVTQLKVKRHPPKTKA